MPVNPLPYEPIRFTGKGSDRHQKSAVGLHRGLEVFVELQVAAFGEDGSSVEPNSD